MRLLFNYLLLTTCILLLRVGSPFVAAADGEHPSIQSLQDYGDLSPAALGLGVPVEEEVELNDDEFRDLPGLSQRVKKGLDLRAKFSVLGHESSCSRAGLAGHPHLRL